MSRRKEIVHPIKDRRVILDESLPISMAEKFRSDRKAWSKFVRSGKKTIKIIDGLVKSNALPLIPEDIINDPTESYKTLLTETKTLLKGAEKQEPNETVIDNMMTLLAPFAGVDELKAAIEHPDKAAAEYRTFIKSTRRSAAFKAGGDEMGNVVEKKFVWAFLIAEMSYLAITYMDAFTDFSRFGMNFESRMGLTPYILGVIYYTASSVRAAKRPFMKEYRKKAMEFIQNVLVREPKDGVSDSLVFDNEARNAFISDRLNNKIKIHDSSKPDALGSQLFKGLYELYPADMEAATSLVNDIWYFGTNKGKEYFELQAAKQLTFMLIKQIKTLEERLAYMPLASDTGAMNRRVGLEAEYYISVGKLLELLDQAGAAQLATGEPSMAVANSLWNKVINTPISRRKFLKGLGWAGFAAGLTFVHSYLIDRGVLKRDDGVDLITDGLNNRKEVEAEEVVDKIEIRTFSRMFKRTLIDVWPELPDIYPDMLENFLNTDGYGDRIQVQAQIYFAANYEIDPSDKKANQAAFEKFLSEIYVPRMIDYSKALDLNPISMIAGVVLSADNITDVERQNSDVSVSKKQMVLGGLGWWLHINWGVPLSEFAKMALYEMVGPYNAPRLTGQVTIGFNDIEIPLISAGFYQLPKDIRTRLLKTNPEVEQAFSNIAPALEAETKRKAILQQQVSEYVELYANQDPDRSDERSPVFELVRKNQGWEAFGLGENPSFTELAIQTTRLTRVWAQLYHNYQNKLDPGEIYQTSFREAREQIITIANQEGIQAAATALIADQIENPEFRRWWLEKEKLLPEIVKKIIKTYEDLEYDGGLIRGDIAKAYKVLSPLEYSYDFQLATGLGTIKYLTRQKKQFQYLNSLSFNNPLWEMFLALAIREIAPRTLLTQESNYPNISDFDPPYNFEDSLETIQALAINIARIFGINKSMDVLTQLNAVLHTARVNGVEVAPHFLNDQEVWDQEIVPHLRRLDIENYSSVHRAMDALYSAINAGVSEDLR